MVVIPWIKALHFLSTCSMCYNPLFLIYLIFVLFVCFFFPTQIPQLLCLHLVQVCILLKLSEYCFSLLVLFLLFASSHFLISFCCFWCFFLFWGVIRYLLQAIFDSSVHQRHLWIITLVTSLSHLCSHSCSYLCLGASCHWRNGPSFGCSSAGLSLPLGNLVPFWGSPSEYIKFRFRNKV